MHLRCVSLTIVHNLVHVLLIISLALQTSLSQQKESIPEFENFPIIDSDLDGSDEDTQQKTDEWMQRTSSSSITVGNVHTFGRVLPKFSSADDAVNHVINSGIIENLENEELEKISKKYNNIHNENNDNESYDNNNSNDDNDNNDDYLNQEFRSQNNRNRLSHRIQLLRHLYKLYKLKSSGVLTKRGEGPQLSIVNPLDVLRQRLLLELARRKMKENQDQIQANAEILKKIGKRSVPLIPTTRQSIFTTNSIHRKYLSDTNKPLLDSNSHKSCNNCQKSKRKERSTGII